MVFNNFACVCKKNVNNAFLSYICIYVYGMDVYFVRISLSSTLQITVVMLCYLMTLCVYVCVCVSVCVRVRVGVCVTLPNGKYF